MYINQATKYSQHSQAPGATNTRGFLSLFWLMISLTAHIAYPSPSPRYPGLAPLYTPHPIFMTYFVIYLHF